MDSDTLRDRWRAVAAWLDASPAEMAGLALLLTGALAVVGVLWWTGRPVPAAPPPPIPSDAAAAPSDVPGAPGASEAAADSAPGEVTVHVAGAVARPGLVRLPDGARVADALQAAGGLLLDAEPGVLNLARAVTDGERLDVPRLGEDAAATHDAAEGAPGGIQTDGVVALNRATTDELETLPGVGPVLAGRIVAWRDANGPFTEVGQLREVAGIGEKTFQALADLVTL